MNVGDVVRSTHGHDKGGIFMVFAVDGNYVSLADGRKRRVEKPKRKKIKHIQKIVVAEAETVLFVADGHGKQKIALTRVIENVTNKALWAALRKYRQSNIKTSNVEGEHG